MTASPAFEDRVLRFLELSQDILSLIGHENAILLEKGELSFEAYVMRKVDLMNNFEKEARNLLSLISEGAEKMNAQAIMINEIRRVRDALKVNSGYQEATSKVAAGSYGFKVSASDLNPPPAEGSVLTLSIDAADANEKAIQPVISTTVLIDGVETGEDGVDMRAGGLLFGLSDISKIRTPKTTPAV